MEHVFATAVPAWVSDPPRASVREHTFSDHESGRHFHLSLRGGRELLELTEARGGQWVLVPRTDPWWAILEAESRLGAFDAEVDG